MHTRMSLFKGGGTHSSTRRTRTTSRRRPGVIAGLLVHAREMSAVLAQWSRSPTRLVPGTRRRSTSPGHSGPGRADPDPALQPARSRRHGPRSDGRIPACNPFLAFAGLLQAGLEGIERAYELPDEMTTNSIGSRRRSGRSVASSRCPARSARPSRRSRPPSYERWRLGNTSFRATSSQAAGVERVPHPGHGVGEGEVPQRALLSAKQVPPSGSPSAADPGLAAGQIPSRPASRPEKNPAGKPCMAV